MIESSGLSHSEFARVVMGREPRTVRKWLAGEPMPATAIKYLTRLRSVAVAAKTVTVTVARRSPRRAHDASA